MNTRMGLLEWGALLIAAALYASAFFFNKVAVGDLPPLTVAAGRLALAAATLLALLTASGQRLPAFGPAWKHFIVLGILVAAIPFTMIAWSQRHIDSALAGIIYGTIPIFAVLFAHFMTDDEKLTMRRTSGIAIGLTGLIVVVGPDTLAGLTDQVFGAALVFIGALAYGVGSVYIRRVTGMSVLVLTTGQMIVGTALMAPLSLIIEDPFAAASTANNASLLAVGGAALLGTALPGIVLFGLIRRSGATNASFVAFFIPVFAVIFGAALLGENVTASAMAGLVLILASMVIVGGGSKEKDPQPQEAD